MIKIDVNLLNQHCKPADWLAEWITDLLRHFDSQGTKDTWALEHLRHPRHSKHLGTQGTWTLGHLRHLDTRRALGHSRHSRHSKGTQGTWVLRQLRHPGTERTLRHSRHLKDTWALGNLKHWALGHSGTWPLGHTKGTWTLWYSSTWALKKLEALYLADSPFVVFKKNKNLQAIIRDDTIKNGKVLKTHLENRKWKCEPCSTKHHYVPSRPLTLVYSKVAKHSSYTLYFKSSTVKANSSFT